MIVDINKIYVLSAPQAAEGMPDFIESTSSDMTYVKMKRLHVGESEVHSIAKVFQHKNLWLQAVIFVTDLPINEAKKRLDTKIKELQRQQNQKEN